MRKTGPWTGFCERESQVDSRHRVVKLCPVGLEYRVAKCDRLPHPAPFPLEFRTVEYSRQRCLGD